MKRTLILAFVLAAGCGTYEDDVAPDPADPAPAPAPVASARDAEIDILKLKINERSRVVADVAQELSDIASNRRRLDAEPASESKTAQMVQLNQAEADAKLRKQAAEADIARMKAQISGESPPATVDQDLEALVASEKRRDSETEEAKRIAADQAQAAESRKLKEAEQARMAAELAKANTKPAGGAGAAGDAVYEERFADLIIKVKAEIRKIKR